MAELMALTPSEYAGDAGTCVVGRAVILRGPFKLEKRANGDDATATPKAGKGKKGGKGKNKVPQEMSQKAEVHFLGGKTLGEVLYMDGWADGATQLIASVKEGSVYRIYGARKIDSAPTYSTSRLDYHLRVIAPIGLKTRIELYEASPWSDLLLHHPFFL